jgi:single-strand DNA-binding protein
MQLIGVARLGRDAELRTAGQQSVTSLSLAYNYGRKDEQGNKPTQWVEADLWGKQAEALAPYLLKGKQVSVIVDEIHNETFQTRDGGTGTKMKGRVINIELVGGSGDARPAAAAAPARAPAAAPAARPAQRAAAPAGGGGGAFEDDIPFSPCLARSAWSLG